MAKILAASLVTQTVVYFGTRPNSSRSEIVSAQ